MNIPMKYEDVVAKLEAERELHKIATETLGQFADENQKLHADLAALREELGSLKKVTSFSDAVACVFDMLKYAAANTSCKEWDAQLEDLAEDVIEFAPEYKKQWKDICALQQRLTVAEQRAAELHKWVIKYRNVVATRRYSDNDEGDMHQRADRIELSRLDAALKPASEPTIEVARQSLSFENQRIQPARFHCLACGEYHEGSGNLPCPKMKPMSGVKP